MTLLKSHSTRLIALVITLLAVLPGAVMAQDDVDIIIDPDPLADDVIELSVATTIESVTSESDEYYGDVVTLQGEIGEFVNRRAFALGQGIALDNDLVLVVNNSTEEIPIEFMNEAYIQVIGRVYPSLLALEEGAQTDFGGLFTVADGSEATENEAPQIAANAVERVDMVRYTQNGNLPEGYENYTIIEILNIENLVYITDGQDEIGN